MKLHFSLLTGCLLAILLLSACQKDAEKGAVTLLFDEEVSGQPVVLNDFRYDCQAGYTFSVIRLKYYVSNFALRKSDGTEYRLDTVHYYEMGLDDTRAFTLRDVPPGTYTQLSFIHGLDETINVDGGLPNTLTNINMIWPLPGDQGYHYMKFEGKYKTPGSETVKAYNLHTGPTGNNQNYIRITLPLNNLKIDGDEWQIGLRMDLNEWLQNPHTYDFETFGHMIMDKQDAQLILKANGADVFRVVSVVKE
jgi:hypothetical protein